ncbi:MAG TPA: hypothetical protein VKV22_09650 [Rhodanobacteraceae bacterium]|nr:hypothetical protein [Rhodanobacteraceae bacterium]
MDITREGLSGSNGLESAAGKVKHGASRMVNAAEDMADEAKHRAKHIGYEVDAWVHRRPVETALLSAAVACLITGLAFWFTRPD